MQGEFIIELWDALRLLIPPKERQAAADHLISIADEYGVGDGIDSAPDLDRCLAAAVQNHYGEDLDDGILDEEY